jgi:hypothetical protein
LADKKKTALDGLKDILELKINDKYKVKLKMKIIIDCIYNKTRVNLQE